MPTRIAPSNRLMAVSSHVAAQFGREPASRDKTSCEVGTDAVALCNLAGRINRLIETQQQVAQSCLDELRHLAARYRAEVVSPLNADALALFAAPDFEPVALSRFH
jgi:hypothetical protein